MCQQGFDKCTRFAQIAIELHFVDQIVHLSLFSLGWKNKVIPYVLPTRVLLQQVQLDSAA